MWTIRAQVNVTVHNLACFESNFKSKTVCEIGFVSYIMVYSMSRYVSTN